MKEKFVDRLLKFVDERGGVYDVAERIDVSPQTFYTMKRRGSLPNLSLIYSLKEVFPELDLEWLIVGSSKSRSNPEVEALQEKLRRTEAIVDTMVELRKKHKGVSSHPQVDREGASEQLSKIIKGGIAGGNRAYLLSVMRNPCRQ